MYNEKTMAKTGLLKASRYNVSIAESPQRFMLVNTLSGAVLRIHESSLRKAHSALLEPEAPFKLSLDTSTLDLLLANGYLVPVEFDELKWLEDVHWKSRTGREVLGVCIAVTLACNFRCSYCYQKRHNIHLNLQLEDSIVNYVSKNLEGKSSLRICWSGGEPLIRLQTIHRMSARLLEVARTNEAEYEGSIVTNGFLLTKTNATILRNLGVKIVQVTIDGPPLIHDKRRILASGHSTFATIFSNLEQVARLFSRVIIRVNIDKRNQDGIAELFQLLVPLREWIELAPRPATSPESPTGEASWTLATDCYLRLDRDLCDLACSLGFRINRGYPPPGTSFCSGYQLNSITVDPYGDVHKCPVCVGRRNQRYGIITPDGGIEGEGGFQKEWDRWSPFLDKECRECKALPACMGGCLWFVGREKTNSLRCLAKNRLIEDIIGKSLLGAGSEQLST